MEWSAIKARTWSIIFATPLDVLRTRYQALREDVNTEDVNTHPRTELYGCSDFQNGAPSA